MKKKKQTKETKETKEQKKKRIRIRKRKRKMEHKKKSLLEVNFSTIEDMFIYCMCVTYISMIMLVFILLYLMINYHPNVKQN